MDRLEYRLGQQMVRTALILLGQVDLTRCIDAASQAESIGPILDPTLYITKGDALHQDLELFRAAAHFKREATRIAKEGE